MLDSLRREYHDYDEDIVHRIYQEAITWNGEWTESFPGREYEVLSGIKSSLIKDAMTVEMKKFLKDA